MILFFISMKVLTWLRSTAASLGQEHGGSVPTVLVVWDWARLGSISAASPGFVAFCINEGFGGRACLVKSSEALHSLAQGLWAWRALNLA